MKTLSLKSARLIAAGTILLLVLASLLLLHKNRWQDSTLRSGAFKQQYKSSTDRLQKNINEVRKKMNDNMTGDLELLPEEFLKVIEKRKTPEEIVECNKPQLKNIRLRGIFWSESNPLVEINDRLCRPGDEISGFTVAKIEPYQVILTDPDGTNYTVSIVRDL